MKACLTNIAEITTCHGILDFYKAKTLVTRLLWFLILLLAFGAICFYQYNNVATYLTTPTATKISKVTVDNLLFPNVTVCNLNAYSLQHFNAQWDKVSPIMQAYNITVSSPIHFLEYLTLIATMKPVESALVGNYAMEDYIASEFLFKAYNYDVVDFLQSSSYTCEETFFSCLYSLIPMYNCCSGVVQSLGSMGNCYSPSYYIPPLQLADNTLMQSQSGLNYGLTVAMRYNASDVPIFDQNSFNVNGFAIAIGDRLSSIDSLLVTVGPSMQVSVSLSPSRFVYDPTISYCTSENYNLLYTQNNANTIGLCKQECQINATLQYCNCTPIFPNTKFPNSLICSTAQLATCFYGASSVLYKATFRQQVYNCQTSNCPKKCETLLYTPFTVYSSVSSPTNQSMADVQMSVANIFFGEIAYTLVEEKPLMDTTSLISNFGGNLGLFAGMSLITVVQFFFAIFFAITDAIHKRWKTRKSPLPVVYNEKMTDFVRPIYIP